MLFPPCNNSGWALLSLETSELGKANMRFEVLLKLTILCQIINNSLDLVLRILQCEILGSVFHRIRGNSQVTIAQCARISKPKNLLWMLIRLGS